jgi:succinate dehydrogenase/fumarate reductase cytochrome b subunit
MNDKTSPTSNFARRFHKTSAMVLVIFVFFHMLNHLSGLFGIEAYNAVQKVLRLVYRFPPVEFILLLMVSSQLLTGMWLLVRALRRGRPQGFWSWLQVISGGMFFWFLAEHLLALVAARWGFGLDTNFSWPASVMNGPPFTWYFIPYYFLGVVAALSHIGVGLRYWALDAGKPKLGNWIGFGCMSAGVVIGAVVVIVLTETLFEIPLSPEWLHYLQSFVPDYAPSTR